MRTFAVTVGMKAFRHTALRIDLLRRIWRHSLACGILCEGLSQVLLDEYDPQRPGLDQAGLLHNIGSLGLFVAHPRTYAALLAGARGDCLLEKERSVLGIDHCEAGGWLASNWGFPDELRRVVVSHHAPTRQGVFETADPGACGRLNDGWPRFRLCAGPSETIRSPTSLVVTCINNS